MKMIVLAIAVCLSTASQVEAKTSYQIQLQPSDGQTANWQDGVQYVDDTKLASIVRVVSIQDALPDKQSTFRVFVLNNSDKPITFGPENIAIEYGDGERVAMATHEELEGKLRRDIKRREALAVLGGAFSAQGANGYTTGSFSGTTSYGGHVSGTYSGYDSALARQQQQAAQEQSAAVNRAIQTRQLSGTQALDGMIQRSTVEPGVSFGGIVAYDAPSSFKRLTKSGLVVIVVNVAGEEHRIAAKVSQVQ